MWCEVLLVPNLRMAACEVLPAMMQYIELLQAQNNSNRKFLPVLLLLSLYINYIVISVSSLVVYILYCKELSNPISQLTRLTTASVSSAAIGQKPGKALNFTHM